MNKKRIIGILLGIFSLLVFSSKSFVLANTDSWFGFDDANNGETYSWEGDPMGISFDQNGEWENLDELADDISDGKIEWANDDTSDEDSQEEEENTLSEFDLTLRGRDEVPTSGDPNGKGTANVRLHKDKGLVCVDIEVAKISLPATDAHIHKAEKGKSGSVFLALPIPNEDGDAFGCVKATEAQITEMMDSPKNFYVNVHSEEYSDGAVRGQLE